MLSVPPHTHVPLMKNEHGVMLSQELVQSASQCGVQCSENRETRTLG